MSQSYKKILSNLKETPPRELNDHILVIDSMNTFIRSFSMLKAMNPQGHHIGGLVGFLRSLGYVTRIFEPTRILCVFDGKGSSVCLLYTSPSPRDRSVSRMPSSA